jgi:hypothetical protein
MSDVVFCEEIAFVRDLVTQFYLGRELPYLVNSTVPTALISDSQASPVPSVQMVLLTPATWFYWMTCWFKRLRVI